MRAHVRAPSPQGGTFQPSCRQALSLHCGQGVPLPPSVHLPGPAQPPVCTQEALLEWGGLPGVTTRNFDCFTINSDENLFHFIILISAVFLKTFVLLRTVHVSALCCPRRCLFRPHSPVCKNGCHGVSGAPLALSWIVCKGQESQGPQRCSTLARSVAHLLGAPRRGGGLPLPPSEFF